MRGCPKLASADGVEYLAPNDLSCRVGQEVEELFLPRPQGTAPVLADRKTCGLPPHRLKEPGSSLEGVVRGDERMVTLSQDSQRFHDAKLPACRRVGC